MLDRLIRILESFSESRIFAIMVAASLFFTGIIVSLMSIVFRGVITRDYLITGFITALVVSALITWFTTSMLRRLRESEKKFRSYIENAPNAVLVSDLSGRFLDCNSAAVELLGYDIAALKGLSAFDIHPEQEREAVRQALETVARYGQFRGELRIRRRDGTVRWVSLNVNVIGSARVLGYLQDITERKQAAEELAASERKYRLLHETMRDAFVSMDMQGRITEFNRAYREMLGYSQEELLKLTYVDITPEKWHSFEAKIVEEHVLARGFSDVYEKEYRRKDGTVFPIEMRKYLVNDESGNPVSMWAIVCDITDRKGAEEALRVSERQYRQLVDNALVGVYKTTLEGRFLYVNEALAKIFECESAEEVLRLPVLRLYKKLEDREAFLNVLKELGKVPYYELEVIAKTGKLKTIVISAALEDGVITGTITDITERKHLEAQLRHAQKMEAIGTLTGGIAHDFNNILNVIIGFSTMVQDSLEASSPSKEQMNEVHTAAEKAVILIRRLLAFSRRQVIEVKPLNINELVLGLQRMLVRIIGEDIDLQIALADRPLVVLADPSQIEQVLMNLATNARDAMPKGGGLRISTRLEEIDDEYVVAHGYGKPGMYGLIMVGDTGSGIDEETQKKMFEPFYTTKGVGEGTGLGLSISYGIIKQHGGYINVYSEMDRGTVFKIYLPLMEEAAVQDKQAEASHTAMGGSETILVAEDDASLRNLIRIVLESSGYSVITAEDGEDAIIKFMDNRDKVALVVLDMIMPKKSGKEVSDVIRKESFRMKILFTSGYAMDTMKTEELTASGFEFIQKPVMPQRLLSQVREVLDK